MHRYKPPNINCSTLISKHFNSEVHETLRSENNKFAGLLQTISNLHFFPWSLGVRGDGGVERGGGGGGGNSL